MRSAILFVIAAALSGAACSSNPKMDPSEINLSTQDLACPSDTLILSIRGGFPSDTMVSFEAADMTFYNGDADVLDDGTIACGLPPDAPAGMYEVIIDGKTVGNVTLDATNC